MERGCGLLHGVGLTGQAGARGCQAAVLGGTAGKRPVLIKHNQHSTDTRHAWVVPLIGLSISHRDPISE